MMAPCLALATHARRWLPCGGYDSRLSPRISVPEVTLNIAGVSDDRDQGPSADADAITGTQSHRFTRHDLNIIDSSAVGRTRIDDGPHSIRLTDEDGVQARDAWIGR